MPQVKALSGLCDIDRKIGICSGAGVIQDCVGEVDAEPEGL